MTKNAHLSDESGCGFSSEESPTPRAAPRPLTLLVDPKDGLREGHPLRAGEWPVLEEDVAVTGDVLAPDTVEGRVVLLRDANPLDAALGFAAEVSRGLRHLLRQVALLQRRCRGGAARRASPAIGAGTNIDRCWWPGP